MLTGWIFDRNSQRLDSREVNDVDEDLVKFKNLDIDDKLWDIKGDILAVDRRLADGDRTIGEIRKDLDDHTEDPDAHGGLILPDPWYRDRRKQTAAGGAGALVLTVIVLIFDYLGA